MLNDIIYKIHTTENADKMRLSLLKSLQYLIPYEYATFYLSSDPEDEKLANPVGVGLSEEQLQDYLNVFEGLDYTRWLFSSPRSKACRETDILPDSARIHTPYYKAMYQPSGIHFTALLSIVYNNVFLGVITLYRKTGDTDFTDEEVMILDLLKDHLGYRLYQDSIVLAKGSRRLSSEQMIEEYHLTMREIEIVRLVMDGVNNQMVCNKLCISPNTLKKHSLNIYKKLGINSWRELLRLS